MSPFVQTGMVTGFVPFIIIPGNNYPILVWEEFLPEPLSLKDKIFY